MLKMLFYCRFTSDTFLFTRLARFLPFLTFYTSAGKALHINSRLIERAESDFLLLILTLMMII